LCSSGDIMSDSCQKSKEKSKYCGNTGRPAQGEAPPRFTLMTEAFPPAESYDRRGRSGPCRTPPQEIVASARRKG